MGFALAGPQTDHCDPGHRNSERNVEETSAVIDMPTERKVGDVRTAGVDQVGAEQTGIKSFPAVLAAHPGQEQGTQKSQFLDEVQRIKIVSVGWHIDNDVLPGDHNEDVEISPPDHHQGKIEAAQAGGILILRSMRPERQSGHQRDNVQEKNDVGRA